jgi:hypothetical protein
MLAPNSGSVEEIPMAALPSRLLRQPRLTRNTPGAIILAAMMIAAAVVGTPAAQAAFSTRASWTAPKAIPSALTAATPALAQYGGRLYAAWAGKPPGPFHIWYSSYNGKSWSKQATVPSAVTASGAGPALTVYNGDLYLAWEGASSTPKVYYSSFNGTSWSSAAAVPSALTYPAFGHPGLAAFNGDLYVSWTGKGGSNVWYSAFSGTTWTTPTTIPSVNGSPSLAVYKKQLFAAEFECEPTCPVTYEVFNGTTWTTPKSFPSSDTPNDNNVALAVDDNVLYAAWIDSTTNEVAYAPYNGSWLAELLVPASGSCPGPALGAYGSSLFAAWEKGTLCGSHGIEYSAGP